VAWWRWVADRGITIRGGSMGWLWRDHPAFHDHSFLLRWNIRGVWQCHWRLERRRAGGFLCGLLFTLLAGISLRAVTAIGIPDSCFGDPDFGVIGSILAFVSGLFK
jgi:hypothetical protein